MASHFKKLTDCPENLREAIDWLIQVRHGNGDGLENLAKAVKKLIEEAIEKAYKTNVDALLKALDSAKSYYCCKEKVAEIEKLKEPKSLGDYPLEHIKTKCNSIIDCPKYHFDSSQQKAYEEIQSKLQQLGKLKESLTGLTDESKCKDLLTNLCSGLETFLGFNSATKGYDGTGIVYSDLDRLCDAVMAFLQGLLESVKDDDSVKTYDVTEGNKLSEVAGKIEKLYKSSGEFNSAIDAIMVALQTWNGEVWRRIENVNDSFMHIKTKHLTGNEGFSRALGDLGKVEIKNIAQVAGTLQTCLTQAHMLRKDYRLAEYYFNRLDPHLKSKLRQSVHHVKLEVETFVAAATNKELHELLVFSEKQLRDLKEQVNSRILYSVNVMAGNLMDAFKKNIQDPISSIENTLKTVQSNLNDWIEKGKEVVAAAIKQSGEIVKILEGNPAGEQYKERNKVYDAAKKLKNDADVLLGAVQSAKGGLAGLAASIKRKVKALEKVYKMTLKDLRYTVQVQVQRAQESLKGLEAQVRLDLEGDNFQGPIKEKIRMVIKAFQDGIRRVGTEGSPGSSASLLQEFSYGANRDDAAALYGWVDVAKNSSLGGALTALQKGFETREFSSLKEFLKQFPDLTEEINGKRITLFDAITGDLESKVKEAIKTITLTLSGKMPHYHVYAKNQAQGTIYDAIQEIKNNVDGYFKGKDSGVLTEEKLKRHDYEVDGRNKSVLLTEEIDKVSNQCYDVLNDAVDTTHKAFTARTFPDQFQLFHQTLAEFTESVKHFVDATGKPGRIEDKGVQTLLTELDKMFSKNAESLRYDLKKNLEGIKMDIVNIIGSQNEATTVLGVINKAGEFYQQIQTDAEECVNKIKLDVETEIVTVTNNIQYTAKTHYYSNVTERFNKMKNRVSASIGDIKNLIDEDRHTGVKGLLKEMYKQNGLAFAGLKCQGTLPELSKKLNDLLHILLDYSNIEVKTPVTSPLPRKLENVQSQGLWNVKNDLNTLLDVLNKSQHFDHQFSYNLQKLNKASNGLHPQKFTTKHNPELLDALKKGMNALTGQLKKVYISRYSGAFKYFGWDEEGSKKCAKIFCTVSRILHRDLRKLRLSCAADWKDHELVLQNTNPLVIFIDSCGYDLSKSDTEHNGELRKNLNGTNMFDLLHRKKKLFEAQYEYESKTLTEMFHHLELYNDVCHLKNITSPKHPCNIYEMLDWLCGLPYNPVFGALKEQCKTLFGKSTGDKQKEYAAINPDVLKLDASPKAFSATHIQNALYDVCLQSQLVLTAILGQGHADGIYACDFFSNTQNLSYPTEINTLLCMLFDILKRVHQQLYFLYDQCKHNSSLFGWSGCYYGRDIGGSSWRCNSTQCHNPGCGQSRNQIHEEMGDQHPSCGLKSPLQSFLEDGLKGFLPHHVTASGSSTSCDSCSKMSPGMPCKTPMGFPDISLMASHRQTGRHIYNMLHEFCGTAESPLTKLCSMLNCVLPTAPRTLGDMLSYYYNFLNGWSTNAEHRRNPFNEEVKLASFGFVLDLDECSDLFKSPKHNLGHDVGDLYSILFPGDTCYMGNRHCGAYMTSLSSHISATFASKNASRYLSWVVYLTETFYDLLQNLMKDCERTCCLPRSRCRVNGCHRECNVFANSPGNSTYMHPHECDSILNCGTTLTTLYRYGITFADRQSLSGRIKEASITMRSCKDLHRQLNIIIGDRSILSKVIHEIIPNYLLAIRLPFMSLTLALWLLSFLYLLHIMVIRLDLLHIKSHLHSPSSHRIAAQSLLAASRVKALNKLLYLQP